MVVFDRQAYNAGLLLPTKLEKLNEGYQVGPPWLRPLLTAKFFTICQVHGESNRNECNLYCLDCVGEALCSSCTSQHRDHHVVQIRRSSYHDVVRVSELQKVLDLAGVQTYIINSARVVFLNARPQPRHAKGVTKTCEICDRSLLDAYRYCSIGCKLTGIRRHNDMTFHLQPKCQQQGQQIPNTVVDTEMGDVLDHPQQEKQGSPPPAPPPPTSAPTRSSVTSEDTASSGGGGQSSNSKRTRSSRKTAWSSPSSSPLKKQHQEKQQHQEQDEEWESPLPPPATSSDQDMSSILQKSLGTLKLRPDEAKGSATTLSPPTPPPTRTAKRRKGTPHRAPMGL